MKNFIYALINLVPGALKAPARWIADRIWGVWEDINGFFVRVGGAWNRLWTYGRHLAMQVASATLEAYVTLRWLIEVWIPRQVQSVVATVRAWAAPLINRAEAVARALVNDVRAWVAGLLSTVAGAVTSLRNWATQQVAGLWDLLSRVRERVFGVLATPARLVEWIGAAMVSWLLRYLSSQRERIAAWMLRESVAFTRWFASTLESVLVRLL